MWIEEILFYTETNVRQEICRMFSRQHILLAGSEFFESALYPTAEILETSDFFSSKFY